MGYKVKEMFYTLQGEGARTGRPAVFLRFSGCNLWSGREQDREKAICSFCDTDFRGTDGLNGGTFSDPQTLAGRIRSLWPMENGHKPYVVCTGGEPMLQLDRALVDSLHDKGFEVAIETNGTIEVDIPVDWICVSPKAGAPFIQTSGDELKIVFPQEGLDPAEFINLEFSHFFLQPMDGAQLSANTERTISYCNIHPKWRVSLQSHKLLQIP